MLGMHMGRVAAPNRREEEGGRRRDTCDWLQRINRACVAANTQAGDLARAVSQAGTRKRDCSARLWPERSLRLWTP